MQMNRKIAIVLVPVILLACNFLFSPKTAQTPESVIIPPTKATSQPSDDQTFTTTGFTVVRLHVGDGDLQTMLADEAQKATALGQTPVVEFDTTWCPPCQAIDAAIKSNNELMLKAYSGTYIIKLDVDEWGWDNGHVQDFRFVGIPVYFKLDGQGIQTGEVIDGGAWNEDIPENIAPVMDKFFHGT
jgi:thiol-disulfide isomerase/thioredoxin